MLVPVRLLQYRVHALLLEVPVGFFLPLLLGLRRPLFHRFSITLKHIVISGESDMRQGKGMLEEAVFSRITDFEPSAKLELREMYVKPVPHVKWDP